MVEVLNITIEQGESYTSAQLTAAGVDTSTSTADMKLKRKRSQSAADLTCTKANSRIVSGGNGHFTIVLSASDTSALSGEYVYDIDWTSGSTVTKSHKGIIYINEEVSK